MSDTKFIKYLERPVLHELFPGKLVFLSDSKGRYLEPHCLPSHSVEFSYRSGLRLAEGFYWLQRRLANDSQYNDRVYYYIWLSTCDLTLKSGNQIRLRHSTDIDCFSYVTRQIDRYYRLVSQYANVNLVFLEVPPYSVVEYNRAKGLQVGVVEHETDLELFTRIIHINEHIRLRNDAHNVQSPRFRLDLLNIRKRAGKEARRTVRYTHYIDGIHPGPLLSKVWMRRIIDRHFINFGL